MTPAFSLKNLACVLGITCFLAVSTLGSIAHAMEITMPAPKDYTPTSTNALLDAAFAKALDRELDVHLAGRVTTERNKAIKEYFYSNAQQYITSHVEKQTNTDSIVLDIAVDSKQVFQTLQGFGVFHTNQVALVYSLSQKQVPAGFATQLKKLEIIYGLKQGTSQLACAIFPQPDNPKLFYCGLSSNSLPITSAADESLPTAWHSTWSQYFLRQPLPAIKQTGLNTLIIDNWHSPDTLHTFSDQLNKWSSVTNVALVSIHTTPTGLKATWTFKILNKAELETQLNAYTRSRNMNFVLGSTQ